MSEEVLITCNFDRDMLPTGSMNQEINAQFILQVSEAFIRQNPKTYCDLVLLVDTSTSMNEPFAAGSPLSKREAVSHAVMELVKTLDTKDTLSIICYDSMAYIELERASSKDKTTMQNAVAQIEKHAGSTNFEAAFRAAFDLSQKLTQASRRVIFLTDGLPVGGDMNIARDLNRQLAQNGVTVDCMGVGADFNYALMKELSSVSNGFTKVLDSPSQARPLISKALKSAQTSLISSAVLRALIAPGVRNCELYLYRPETRFYGEGGMLPDGSSFYEVNLSNLENGQDYHFMFHGNLDTQATGARTQRIADLTVEYDVPVSNLKRQKSDCALTLSLSEDPKQERRDPEVRKRYMRATLEKLMRECDTAAKANDWKRAGALLMEMKARALNCGAKDQAAEYDRRLRELEQNGLLSTADLIGLGDSTSSAGAYEDAQKGETFTI